MAGKSKVTGVPELKRTLTRYGNKARAATVKRVVVSYNTDYALYVHEDLQANHPNGGQAKYIEQPAVKLGPKLGAQIGRRVAKGVPVEAAMYEAGLALQAASQALVPVDTGNLRASAATAVETKS